MIKALVLIGQRFLCFDIRKKIEKRHIRELHSGKGQNIVLSENEIVVRDSTKVAEILNNYFINNIEINTGSKLHSLPCTETGLIDYRTID